MRKQQSIRAPENREADPAGEVEETRTPACPSTGSGAENFLLGILFTLIALVLLAHHVLLPALAHFDFSRFAAGVVIEVLRESFPPLFTPYVAERRGRTMHLTPPLFTLSDARAASAWADARAMGNWQADVRDAMKSPETVAPMLPAENDPALTRRSNLYENGMGALFSPGVGEVVSCRDKTDPTCRAVQVLDRGFPERPTLPPDINTTRDALVSDATRTSPVTETGRCSPLTITLPARTHEEVCRPGSGEITTTEVIGPRVAGQMLATWWGCVNPKTETTTYRCTQQRAYETSVPEMYLRNCVVPAGEAKTTVRTLTDVTLTARFRYRCTESPVTVETVTCSEKRTVTHAPACPPGESVSVTFEKRLTVAGKTLSLTATHPCGRGTTVSLASEITPAVIRTPGRGGTWMKTALAGVYVRYSVVSLTEDNGTYTAGVSMDVREGAIVTGSIAGKLVFPSDSAMRDEVTWVDDCAPFKKGSAA